MTSLINFLIPADQMPAGPQSSLVLPQSMICCLFCLCRNGDLGLVHHSPASPVALSQVCAANRLFLLSWLLSSQKRRRSSASIVPSTAIRFHYSISHCSYSHARFLCRL